MRRYLQVADESSQEDSDLPRNTRPAEAARAAEPDGATGASATRGSGERWAVRGPRENADLHLARRAALQDAAAFGMIGLLASGGGDPRASSAPWGHEDALGSDLLSARGNLWGDEIGDTYGTGLGLTGVGQGGGGRGEGVGLGGVGAIGLPSGLGQGFGCGCGVGGGRGRLGGNHHATAPSVRFGAVQVAGRLPAEAIQRIVRQSFGRFRRCYEAGLRTNPGLQGRVAARFAIGRDGAVVSAADGGSDLPDAGVVSCVQRAFYGLSFPPPEGGIVTVTYPILFTPAAP